MTDRQQLITSVKEVVLEVAPGAEIILFGSRSRGDHREESDWDFLILIDRPATEQFKKKIRTAVYRVELELSAAISTIIYSKKEWPRLKVTPLYQSVEEDGILL